MANTPEKHTVYFELVEALRHTAGCAVCHLAGRSAHRYLDTLLYENVNDVGTRSHLQASGGFCARHAQELLGFRDGLGTCLLYRDRVEAAIAWLDSQSSQPPRRSWWRRRSSAASPCPACEQETAATQRYLETIHLFLAEPELHAALENSPGLCLPHLQLAIEACHGESCRESLLAIHRHKFRQLLDELDEFVRKCDYQFAAEPYGAERDVWFRAVNTMHGWPRGAGAGGPADR